MVSFLVLLFTFLMNPFHFQTLDIAYVDIPYLRHRLEKVNIEPNKAFYIENGKCDENTYKNWNTKKNQRVREDTNKMLQNHHRISRNLQIPCKQVQKC